MKITCNRNKLSKSINYAARLVPSRSELPILSNLLLQAENGFITVFATNLQLSVSAKVPSEVHAKGETTAPAGPIQGYVSSLPSETVDIEYTDQKLHIKSEASSAQFVTMDAADYPVFPEKEDEPILTFKTEVLARLIKKVKFAAASDESRPVLTGVLILVDNGETVMAATDGFRLSEVKGSVKKSPEEKIQLIVPANALSEVEKLMSSAGEEEVNIFLSKDKNQIIFDFVSVQLASRLLEAEYPDYKKILPTEFDFTAQIDKDEILKSVELASIFAQRDGQTVYLTFNNDTLTIEARSTEVGESKEEMPIHMEGDELYIAFNSQFLREGLESIDSDEVLFKAKDSLSPIRMSNPSGDAYFHVVMPIRVEDE